MQNIFIITPIDIEIEKFIERLPNDLSIEKQSNDSFLISSETNHCWIEYCDDVREYFEEESMIIM